MVYPTKLTFCEKDALTRFKSSLNKFTSGNCGMKLIKIYFTITNFKTNIKNKKWTRLIIKKNKFNKSSLKLEL